MTTDASAAAADKPQQLTRDDGRPVFGEERADRGAGGIRRRPRSLLTELQPPIGAFRRHTHCQTGGLGHVLRFL